MDFKYQSLILIALILFSLTLTQLGASGASEAASGLENQNNQATSSKNLEDLQSASVADFEGVKKTPERKWNVLDPEINSKAALVYSLDDEFPLLSINAHEEYSLASLTKLITAVVVIEDIGLTEKITITAEAVDNPWKAGHLKSGQVYYADDLLKLMLLTSSNDAANAFEEHLGGKEEFVKVANNKMEKVGISEDTIINDGSGLNDSNMGTADDFLKLSKYILKNHPKIFTWTRNYEMLIQPVESNDLNVQSRTEMNINGLVENRNFLGGKTGTSQIAGENLVALFDSGDRRMLVILMGSENRSSEAQKLLNWAQKAYNFE